jgi:hypothetical protein
MAQVQQIYACLFAHIDVATSLLKQDLVDAEFVREQNQRIFTKLNAIQDATLMRSFPQEAELHNEYMSDGRISLGDSDDYGSISRRSSPCIPTKSLPLDESGYPPDRSTPCRTDSPHVPSYVPSNRNSPNDLALPVRSEFFPMSDSLVDGVSGRLLTGIQHSLRHEPSLDVTGSSVRHDLDQSAGSGPYAHSVPSQGDIWEEETRDHEVFYSIHPPANYLNYRQTTQSLTQDHQDLPAKISHLDQPQHSEQAADAEQDSYFRQDTHVEQELDSEHGTQPGCDTLRTHS